MNDFEEKYKKLHADYYEECGMIMDMINSIEIRLSSFISKVVCKSEYIEVFDRFVMYDSLTFNSKKMLFMNLKSNSLLEKYFPYKKIGGDLDYIQILRNKMAHATLLTDNERINLYDAKYLILISHSAKNGQEEVRYNISDEKEDVKKLIFSKSGVIERADRLLKWFDSKF